MVDHKTKTIEVILEDGNKMYVEATMYGGEEEVALKGFHLNMITKSIGIIYGALRKTLEKFGPDKVTVEFGIEFGVKEGVLTGILTQGEGKMNVKLSLEWENGK
jgi:hypothetical protein